MATTHHHHDRAAVGTMYAGLALTVAAAAAPFVDRASGHVLADHIRDGYPTYSADRIDSAVTTWLVLLGAVGVLGVISWATSIWAVTSHKSWSRLAATAAFAVGTVVALSALLTKDTSGEVGLAPMLGLIGMLPCVAGLGAVALLWRRS